MTHLLSCLLSGGPTAGPCCVYIMGNSLSYYNALCAEAWGQIQTQFWVLLGFTAAVTSTGLAHPEPAA